MHVITNLQVILDLLLITNLQVILDLLLITNLQVIPEPGMLCRRSYLKTPKNVHFHWITQHGLDFWFASLHKNSVIAVFVDT
jgi:hypothetical protein